MSAEQTFIDRAMQVIAGLEGRTRVVLDAPAAITYATQLDAYAREMEAEARTAERLGLSHVDVDNIAASVRKSASALLDAIEQAGAASACPSCHGPGRRDSADAA